MVKGFTQIKGVDYEETFSLVVRIASICLLLALVANLDLELFQMVIKTIFLNGNLEEEIYMDLLTGFVSKGQEDKVCLIKRLIYDLKQSFKPEHFRFHEPSISFSLNMVFEDYCMSRKLQRGLCFLLCMLTTYYLLEKTWR